MTDQQLLNLARATIIATLPLPLPSTNLCAFPVKERRRACYGGRMIQTKKFTFPEEKQKKKKKKKKTMTLL